MPGAPFGAAPPGLGRPAITEAPPLGLFRVNEAGHFTSSELCVNVFEEFGTSHEHSSISPVWIFCALSSACLAADVLTYHNDNGRTGWN